ncbi:hypothetical protein QLX08_002315 [Tetragonisca angustula]|uniref:Uncharacterized protein n=1 Tax=Tetragonisca angustula TaxID=166442 RepID=A0AAW1ABY0_9HYME
MNEATKFFPFRILYQSTSGFYRQPSGIERYLALFRIMSTTNSGSESSDASVVARSEEREKESAARSRGGSSPSISVSSNRLVGKVIVAVKQVRRSKTSRTSGQRRNESKQKVIALLSICTVFLTCCAVHAIVYRKSAYSDVEDSAISSVYNQLPKWVPQVTKHPV